MRFAATTAVLSLLSLSSLATAHHAYPESAALARREANPLAAAYAESVADAHPDDVPEIHGIYARAAEAAKSTTCKRELSPRCLTQNGHLRCTPSSGRITMPNPTGPRHANPVPIDCKQITECKNMLVMLKKNAPVPQPALAACRHACNCEP